MKSWKPVVGYEEYYIVSSEGEVFSLRTNKIMREFNSPQGYKRVELNVGGMAIKKSVHRLVAEAFIPNPNNYPVINHKDENPQNNNVDNLEWCTYKYNTNYGTCIERRVANTDYKYGFENARSEKVYQFDLEGNLVDVFGSMHEAERATGFDSGSISKVCTGALKQYRGYVWSKTKEFNYQERRNTKFKKGFIEMYDMQGTLVKTYKSPLELEQDGYSQVSVNRVCRGERKSYKGFVFKHVE